MNQTVLYITFTLKQEGIQFSSRQGDENILYCGFEDGKLDVAIKYDFRDMPPLHLTASANCGDQIQVSVLPYRLELYVNGILSDEEWPCGNHFLQAVPIIDKGCDLQLQTTALSKAQEPSVLGTFQNAEGWKPEENVFVGDCMPYCHDGVYHVLYLKDRHHHHSKWQYGAHQWSHISTSDFQNWNIHPMAVEIDDPTEGSICTGSWIFDGVTHYLFYTVRMCDGSPAKICRSVSQDGFHFEKDRDFSFILSDKYTAPSARDPKVIKAADGRYHMLLTTSLSHSKLGCLAHLVSTDLNTWQELDSPLYVAPDGMGEPECPDYFYKDGFYYLICSLRSKAFYQYSKKPFTDWQMAEDPIIPCKSVPKAAIWNNRLVFTGFDGKGVYGGTMTFLEATTAENGQLRYSGLK